MHLRLCGVLLDGFHFSFFFVDFSWISAFVASFPRASIFRFFRRFFVCLRVPVVLSDTWNFSFFFVPSTPILIGVFTSSDPGTKNRFSHDSIKFSVPCSRTRTHQGGPQAPRSSVPRQRTRTHPGGPQAPRWTL